MKYLFYGGPVHGSFRELRDTNGPVYIPVPYPLTSIGIEPAPWDTPTVASGRAIYNPYPNFLGSITYVADGWLNRYVKQQTDFIDSILSRHYTEIKELERIKFRLEHAR